MEPVTRPNEIFVTAEFEKEFRDTEKSKPDNIRFDRLGEIPLAKGFGLHDVYRLRQDYEEEHVIDRLVRQDLIAALPNAPDLSEEEKLRLGELKRTEIARLPGRDRWSEGLRRRMILAQHHAGAASVKSLSLSRLSLGARYTGASCHGPARPATISVRPGGPGEALE